MATSRIHPAVRALSLLWLLPKRALLRHRLTKPTDENVCDHPLVVEPEVFNPVIFRTGRFFAEYLYRDYLSGSAQQRLSILDLGTGSGVLGIVCAARGHEVLATDINPAAVDCAQRNIAANGYQALARVALGDLFDPAGSERFDLVLWNPPFFKGAPRNPFDMSWRSEDAIDRFAEELPSHLKPRGHALVLWSSQGDDRWLEARFAAHGLKFQALRQGHFGVERLTIYRVDPA